jgi:hypothetical protein
VYTIAKKPELLMMTLESMCFKIRKRTMTLEPQMADVIAAQIPNTLLLEDDGVPKINEGLIMQQIPSIVKIMLKMLKSPHFSLRKIFENMATKTGVE